MDLIGYREGDHVFIMSCGVLFYFQREDVKRLIDAIGHHFPGAHMCFDYENAKILARSNKAVRKTGNKGAYMPFSMEDGEKEIKVWLSPSRYYMVVGKYDNHRYGLHGYRNIP